jgi:hypothetical protein
LFIKNRFFDDVNMIRDTHNLVFDQAVAFINQTNQHIFLTGKAGTGKTTFLKYIRAHTYKKMAVVAPTGVAAINAGGVTIHSFFQLPFGTFLPTAKSVWGGDFQQVFNKNQLLAKLRFNAEKRSLLQELDVLVIDEISMVRADVMDAIDTILRWVRHQPNEPFGGLQLLLIGDMFQLPPVVKDSEMQLMSEYYASPYFFDAESIKEASPLYLELKKIYRQSDHDFINILNHVRNNDFSEEDLEILQRFYHPYFVPDRNEGFITLTSHNAKADSINQEALERLPGKGIPFKAKIFKDFPEHAYPVEETLLLKEGAQIMFIKNDKGENRRFYNGKIATIERINVYDNEVWVKFPNENDLLQLELETWRNIKFQYNNEVDEVEEEELGTYSQYPIRLAWAVTIHKSQGLTFDKAIVDAGQSFAPGQVYVALSRLRGLEGLVLKSKITPASIMTDERIINFAKTAIPDDRLAAILAVSQEAFTERSLIQAFDWLPILEAWKAHIEAFAHRTLPNQAEAVYIADAIMQHLIQEHQTALSFANELNKLIQEGKTARTKLHERMQAASKWFVNHLEQQVLQPLKAHIGTEKIKPRTKKYVRELKALLIIIERKKLHLMQAASITEGLALAIDNEQLMDRVSKLYVPLEIAVEEKEEKKTKTKAPVGESKRISLDFFKKGESIEAIAEMRGMAQSTIEGHLADFITTGEIAVNELVSTEKIAVILQAIQQNPEATSSIIREKIGSHYSYAEIKAVYLHYKKINHIP